MIDQNQLYIHSGNVTLAFIAMQLQILLRVFPVFPSIGFFPRAVFTCIYHPVKPRAGKHANTDTWWNKPFLMQR